MGKPKDNKHLQRPVRKRKNNLKTDFTEISLLDKEGIRLAQNLNGCLAFVNRLMNIRVLKFSQTANVCKRNNPIS